MAIQLRGKRGIRFTNRNPEYSVRDKLFEEACDKCARKRWCSFVDSMEGAEAVCNKLILSESTGCECCLRPRGDGKGGRIKVKCTFTCCFFVQKQEFEESGSLSSSFERCAQR